jgi:tryptophan synthase alpha chain
MNRIEKVLKKDEKLLIPYITPEFPFPGVTLRLLEALAESGADMIEVGIPFSDPIADGVTIQNSSLIALKNGITLKKIFDLISLFRRNYDTPIILMGYANSIISRGLEKFIFGAVNSGVDGLIVPDLPVDEAENLIDLSKSYGLSNIFLVAPNSSEGENKTYL